MKQSSKKSSPVNTMMSHQPHMSTATSINTGQLEFGDVVQFTYDRAPRLVYVVNPNWDDCIHGLTLEILDRRHLLSEIIDKVDTTTDPYHFYNRYLTTELMKHFDCYRTYKLSKVTNLRKVAYELHLIEYSDERVDPIEVVDVITTKMATEL